MFHNCTGRRLLLETGGSRAGARVAEEARVELPESATGEWDVYLADTFARIGQFRLAADDGRGAWAARAASSRLYDVTYVPRKGDAPAYYVAWRCPRAGP